MEAGVGRAEFRLIFVEMGDEVGDGIGGVRIYFFLFFCPSTSPINGAS